MSHLNSGALNLGLLRDDYRHHLAEVLSKAQKPITLVWETTLMTPIGLITEYSFLQEQGVQNMISIQERNAIKPSPSSVKSVVFIVPGDLPLMEPLANYVKGDRAKPGGANKEYHIVFVPRLSTVCEHFLLEKKYMPLFNGGIHEYPLDMVPLDSDLLSLEMPSVYGDIQVRNDPSVLHQLARALVRLQTVYGAIPRIQGKGELAQKLAQMLTRMRRETTVLDVKIPSKIDSLVLIDRQVDPLTPLLSQLTYEGLLDEKFGIKYGATQLPKSMLEDSSAPSGNTPTTAASGEESTFKKIILNSADDLYVEIRDKNFGNVGPVLHRRVKEVTTERSGAKEAKTIQELKKVVSNLPHLQQRAASISLHMQIAESLRAYTHTDEFMDCLRCQQDFLNGVETDKANPYIEDCIAREESLYKILRLMAIQSFCNHGLKPKLYEYYKREVVQVYGLPSVFFWDSVERVGLITCQSVSVASSVYRSPWAVLRKTLKLTAEDQAAVNEAGQPLDMTHIFSGYAPLSCRLIQYLFNPGWRAFTEALALLPGPEVDQIYGDTGNSSGGPKLTGLLEPEPLAMYPNKSQTSANGAGGAGKRLALVVFIGGISFSEVASIRYLSQLEDSSTEYIILTTGFLTHERFIKSLEEPVTVVSLNPFS